MMNNMQIPVLLLTGYLGSGKTTLLNRILANRKGIRFAVIVNDIGEVNIDADLIEKSGGVSREDENLIPLSNGCICCTLKNDLAKQLTDLADTGKYNYIIIEASGICEPIPIAQTISMICEENSEDGLLMKLDNIVAVVDCARMLAEFENGRKLLREAIGEDDLENLLIQQIEFCTTIIMNKTDLVDQKQMNELKAIVHTLQKDAVMVEAVKGGVPLKELLFTDRFDPDRAMASAGWVEAIRHPENERSSSTASAPSSISGGGPSSMTSWWISAISGPIPSFAARGWSGIRRSRRCPSCSSRPVVRSRNRRRVNSSRPPRSIPRR